MHFSQHLRDDFKSLAVIMVRLEQGLVADDVAGEATFHKLVQILGSDLPRRLASRDAISIVLVRFLFAASSPGSVNGVAIQPAVFATRFIMARLARDPADHAAMARHIDGWSCVAIHTQRGSRDIDGTDAKLLGVSLGRRGGPQQVEGAGGVLRRQPSLHFQLVTVDALAVPFHALGIGNRRTRSLGLVCRFLSRGESRRIGHAGRQQQYDQRDGQQTRREKPGLR